MKKCYLLVIVLFLFISSCKEGRNKGNSKVKPSHSTSNEVKKLNVRIIREMEHPGPKLYTQGFEIFNGILYESTGLDNISSLKKIDLKTFQIIQSKDLNGYFAEGLTILDNYITLISYREGKSFSFNTEDLSDKGINFYYETEGWGLTNNGSQFIMSDGSDKIYFRNPLNFKTERTISVKLKGKPIYYVNELEYVDGKIYANVYGSSNIIVIDEKDGLVTAEIDCSNLGCSALSMSNPEAVLNGIAYNKESKTFFVTGKECHMIYEVVFE